RLPPLHGRTRTLSAGREARGAGEVGCVRAGRRRGRGWIVTIEFRPTVRTPEERQEMAAAFETWREWKRSQGNEVDLARLRNRFLNALGPDPLESLRRQVAPAFADLVKNLK